MFQCITVGGTVLDYACGVAKHVKSAHNSFSFVGLELSASETCF